MKYLSHCHLGLLYMVSGISTLTNSFNCDRCRDADLCDTVTGVFRVTEMGRGYHPVVTLPRGACNINVTELAKSENVLALKDVRNGEYTVNGYWSMDEAGVYNTAGAIFSYRKSEARCPGDCLAAGGPIRSQVLVQLLYHGRNTGVFYSYKLPKQQLTSGLDTVTNNPLDDTLNQDLASGLDTATNNPLDDTLNQDLASGLDTATNNPLDDTLNQDRSELREAGIGYKDIPESETDEQEDQVDTNAAFPPIVPIPGPGGIHIRGPIFSSDFAHRRRQSVSHAISHSGSTNRNNNKRRQSLTDVTFSRGIGDDDVLRLDNVDIAGEISLHSTDGGEEGSGDITILLIDEYVWRLSEKTKCSRLCGEGIREYVYECTSTLTSELVDSFYCDGSLKPETQHHVCNAEPCTPQWEKGDWFNCSAMCGDGIQSRDVACKQRISGTDTQDLDDIYCASRKPVSHKECYIGTCYRWVHVDWSDCSVKCGIGTRHRIVQCRDDTEEVVDKSRCDQSTPAIESCDMGSCTQQWYYSQWNGKCSADCGTGVVTRHVFCATGKGHVMSDEHCDVKKKPAEKKQCHIDTDCGGKWFAGYWSQCSQSCNVGVKSRYVICMMTSGNQLIVTGDSNCRAGDKPRERKECSEVDCGYMWYRSEWSQCTKTCGAGVKTRSVKCFDGKMKPSSMCEDNEKPGDTQDCNTDKCWTARARQSGCTDKYPNCHVVVSARLCRYPYYQRKCCRSCSGLQRLY